MKKFHEFFASKKSKILAVVSAACLMMMALPVTAFADETTTFPITSEMLSSVTTNFNSAVSLAAPIGIGIMAVILGINFVPKLIKKLAK